MNGADPLTKQTREYIPFELGIGSSTCILYIVRLQRTPADIHENLKHAACLQDPHSLRILSSALDGGLRTPCHSRRQGLTTPCRKIYTFVLTIWQCKVAKGLDSADQQWDYRIVSVVLGG